MGGQEKRTKTGRRTVFLAKDGGRRFKRSETSKGKKRETTFLKMGKKKVKRKS